MSRYNFDNIIDRRGTASIKHGMTNSYFGKAGLLPFWVADMDFETPDFVRRAVIERATHPVYGYTYRDDRFYEAIIRWMKRRHGWEVKREWIVYTPGVVPALNLAVLATTSPNEGVVVQPPVYFPFFKAVSNHQRVTLHNCLSLENDRYSMNYEGLLQLAPQARTMLLCNPHNPVGRSWSATELERLAAITAEYDLTIISDEIHADLVLPGWRHTVFAMLGEEVAQRTITLHAPSKTFNLAGLATSYAIIPSETLRKRFEHQLEIMHLGIGNIFGFEAMIAAYNNGEEWLNALLHYLEGNALFVKHFLADHMPAVRALPLEATYLMWLDFSATGFTDKMLNQILVEKAGVALSRGVEFGPGGQGFMRLNIACPQEMLQQGLERIADAVSQALLAKPKR